MLTPNVEIILTRYQARVPTCATNNSAGYDFYLASDEPITIPGNGEVTTLPTGVALQPLGDTPLALLLLPRSGIARLHNLTLANAVGLIDPDYREEIMILVRSHNRCDIKVYPGERLCQGLWVEFARPIFTVVHDFSTMATNRQGGLGSTGTLKHQAKAPTPDDLALPQDCPHE